MENTGSEIVHVNRGLAARARVLVGSVEVLENAVQTECVAACIDGTSNRAVQANWACDVIGEDFNHLDSIPIRGACHTESIFGNVRVSDMTHLCMSFLFQCVLLLEGEDIELRHDVGEERGRKKRIGGCVANIARWRVGWKGHVRQSRVSISSVSWLGHATRGITLQELRKDLVYCICRGW